MSPAFIDRTGHRYGRWLVLSQGARDRNGLIKWLCRCDCGTERNVLACSLATHKSKDCGCGGRQKARQRWIKHGHFCHGKKTPTYAAWSTMVQRCTNLKRKDYPRYGGRSICVCERWLTGDGESSGFECFLADMGEKPSRELTLDRIDNDGDYRPDNCRWATATVQRINQRRMATSALFRELKGAA